jgi:hypothetical protein
MVSDWCNDSCIEINTTVHPNESTSWKDVKPSEVPGISEYISEYDDTSSASEIATEWGVDSVFIECLNASGTSETSRLPASNQYVVGATHKRFEIGTFGLGVGLIGASPAVETTTLENLYVAKLIPSRSFSYTAGSVNSKSLFRQESRCLTFSCRKLKGQPGLGRIRYIAVRQCVDPVLAFAECTKQHSHCPTNWCWCEQRKRTL